VRNKPSAPSLPTRAPASPADGSAAVADAAPPPPPRGGVRVRVADVCDALEELELGEHAAAFRRCSMDGSMLGDLAALWDELGVTLTAHRIKIARSLAPLAAAIAAARPAGPA
jgi:hypothetical protein